MNKTLLRDVKLKDGRTFAKGTAFSVAFAKSEKGTTYLDVCNLDGSHSFKTTRFSAFFKAPSLRTMEKWSLDGIAKSVSGHRVEPDGFGPDGSTSWLLVIGVI